MAIASAKRVEAFGPHGAMDLRDWLAGHALNAIVSNSQSVFPGAGFTPWYRHAEEAYKLADAMLADRAKQESADD